jgi:hypothetical protein
VKILLVTVLGACALAQTPPQAPGEANSAAIERDGLRQLLAIKRVYVDHLTGGETAAQMRDILISALDGAKLFVLTETQDHADFILRGAAEDLVFTEEHSSSDGVNFRANVGTGRTNSRSTGENAGFGVGDSESDRSAVRRHEAIAAVRLVNQAGDVVWSTTQESLGAKFRGASADVADKITAKLKEDFERARKLEP